MAEQPTVPWGAFTGEDDSRMREFYTAAELIARVDAALRRPYLTYADTAEGAHEALLVTASVRDTIERCNGFAEATELAPANDLPSDPLVTVPLPPSTEDDTSYRNPLWKVPTMLWHPLAWLPYREACRMAVPSLDGGFVRETTQQWAVRLAWELSASGLYEDERGWVDVLALHGIDIGSQGRYARVVAWFEAGQQGDPVLDNIDLTRYFDALDTVHEAGSSFQITQETVPLYQAAAWSVAARTILDELDAGGAGSAGGGATDLETLKAIVALAYTFFERVAPLHELGGIAPYEALMDLADELQLDDHARIPASADVLRGLARLRQILSAIHASTGDAQELFERVEQERYANIPFDSSSFHTEAAVTEPID